MHLWTILSMDWISRVWLQINFLEKILSIICTGSLFTRDLFALDITLLIADIPTLESGIASMTPELLQFHQQQLSPRMDMFFSMNKFQ